MLGENSNYVRCGIESYFICDRYTKPKKMEELEEIDFWCIINNSFEHTDINVILNEI